jgi:hypothetical protein
MESEVLTPAPGQTVVRTESGHHGHHEREWDRMRWELSRDFASGVAATVHAGEEEQEDAKDTQLAIAASATATLVGFKDLTALTYQVEGRALLEAAKNAAQLGLQATTNFNAIQVEQVKNAAASVLLATQNASAVAAQIAECCCETKALITADGNATRALINSNSLSDAQARIVKLEIEKAAFFTRNVAPVVP